MAAFPAVLTGCVFLFLTVSNVRKVIRYAANNWLQFFRFRAATLQSAFAARSAKSTPRSRPPAMSYRPYSSPACLDLPCSWAFARLALIIIVSRIGLFFLSFGLARQVSHSLRILRINIVLSLFSLARCFCLASSGDEGSACFPPSTSISPTPSTSTLEPSPLVGWDRPVH